VLLSVLTAVDNIAVTSRCQKVSILACVSVGGVIEKPCDCVINYCYAGRQFIILPFDSDDAKEAGDLSR